MAALGAMYIWKREGDDSVTKRNRDKGQQVRQSTQRTQDIYFQRICHFVLYTVAIILSMSLLLLDQLQDCLMAVLDFYIINVIKCLEFSGV